MTDFSWLWRVCSGDGTYRQSTCCTESDSLFDPAWERCLRDLFLLQPSIMTTLGGVLIQVEQCGMGMSCYRSSWCRPWSVEDTAQLFSLHPSPLQAEDSGTSFPRLQDDEWNSSCTERPAWDLTHGVQLTQSHHIVLWFASLCNMLTCNNFQYTTSFTTTQG